MTPKPQVTLRQALAVAGIRRLWIGQLVSIAGDFLALFALLSIASFRMHATPAGITGVTIAYGLPLAIFSPLSGVFVDRWNPKHTMIASDLTRAVLVLLLLFARQLGEIYAILFALSTVSTFFIPAQSVTVRTLVPREGLLAVNTLLQQTILAMRLVSPAVAGALVGKFGAAPCFYFDSLSFFCSALMLSTIAINRPMRISAASPARSQSTVLRDLSAGIRFILSHPEISFVTTAMAAATFTISCFSPLIAVFVRDILHADVRTFAFITTATGLGLIAGMQAVRRFAKAKSPRHVVVFSLALVSVAIVLMSSANLAIVLATGTFLMGTGVGLLVVPAQTLIQSETPLPMAGRVSSAVTSLMSTAQILGLALSATMASAIGLRTLFLSCAVLLGALSALGYATLATPELVLPPIAREVAVTGRLQSQA
jgi:MFS family permease